MKKLYTLLGIIAIGAVIGLTVFGCKKDTDDDDGGVGGNTLVITGVPTAIIDTKPSFWLGLFPTGTDLAGAQAKTNIVAEGGNETASPSEGDYNVTVTLVGWTGSGTYAIYLRLWGSSYYKATATFTTSETTVPWDSFSGVLY